MVPPSHVSTLAWNQRQQRQRRKRNAGGFRTKKQQRILFGFVAAMVGLILIVVHVELSLLHRATTPGTTASLEGNSRSLVVEPGSSNNNNNNNNGRTSHKMVHEKMEPTTRKIPKEKDKRPEDNIIRSEPEEGQKRAHVERREEESKLTAAEAEAEERRDAHKKGSKRTEAEEVKNEAKDTLSGGGTNNEDNAAAEQQQQKRTQFTVTKEDEEDHSDLKALIERTEQSLHNSPLPMTADFCEPSIELPSAPTVAPAVVILGMEDTSTNLLWYVLSKAVADGQVAKPNNPHAVTQLKYNALGQMDPMKEEEFWESLPLTDKGAWVKEALCSQQSEDAHMLGFPWLTLGDMSKNGQSIETLKAIAKLPKDSVKVVRYRRNILDMISRQEQHLTALKENQASHSVTLDKKTLLKSLTHWNARQKAVDKFLEEAQIPHIVVDHEKLFPFNDWKDLVNVTNVVQKFQVPLNVKIDFSRIAPDERPPEPSEMETEWTKVLDYLNIKQPTTLFDIFYSAYNFPQKGIVFWRQQQSLANYAAVQQILTGTHFQALLRNLEYHHDFYGCACNDKEAARARMWKAFKKHKKKEEEANK